MSKPLQLVGQKFGRLTVIAKAGNDKKSQSLWWVRCSCGEYLIKKGEELKRGFRRGLLKSCGCLRRETTIKNFTTHGKCHTSEYSTWQNMKARCLNINNTGYKYYGGRGIKVCDRWLKFENFFEDMGLKPKPELTLERVNNEKGYSPENCIWATKKVQANNRRNSNNHAG